MFLGFFLLCHHYLQCNVQNVDQRGLLFEPDLLEHSSTIILNNNRLLLFSIHLFRGLPLKPQPQNLTPTSPTLELSLSTPLYRCN